MKHYYPQYFKIRLYSPTLCNLGIRHCILENVIKIEDCNDDEPYCDYPEFLRVKVSNINYDSIIVNPSLKDEHIKWNKLRVYDIYGRLIAESETDLFNNNKFQDIGFAFFAYYNKNGELISTAKKYVIPNH